MTDQYDGQEPAADLRCDNCGSEVTYLGSGLVRCKLCGKTYNTRPYQTGGYTLDLLSRPPGAPARCRCGQLTKWKWYEPDQDDPDEPEGLTGEWVEAMCWRCCAVALMKAEVVTGKLGDGSGKLTKAQAERFIELAIKQATMLQAMHVVRFRWPFPWLKPWLWPAWIAWRIKRGRSQERFNVRMPRFGAKP